MRKRRGSLAVLIAIAVVIVLAIIVAFNGFNFGIYTFVPFFKGFEMSSDLAGGAILDFTIADETNATEQNQDIIIRVMRERLAVINYADIPISKIGTDTIRVQLPDNTTSKQSANTDSIATFLSATGSFSFKDESGSVVLTKDYIKNMGITVNSAGTAYTILFEFTEAGNKILEGLEGATLSFDRDGTEVGTMSAASNTLEGDLTYENIVHAVTQFDSGTLPVTLGSGTMVQYNSATMGQSAISSAMMVIAVVIIAVILALIVMYKMQGIASLLSFIIYGLTFVIVLAASNIIQLTLGGVMGMIIATIATIFAMIASMEMTSLEIINGKLTRSAIHEGYNRSSPTILDTFIIIEIICVALYFLGGEVLKSFSIPLGIGLVIGAIVVTLIQRFLSVLLSNLTEKQGLYTRINAKTKA